MAVALDILALRMSYLHIFTHSLSLSLSVECVLILLGCIEDDERR